MNDDSSLSHTRWNCKYHIVFVPKYRRKAIYGKLRAEIGAILRQLCVYKDVEIIEAHASHIGKNTTKTCRIKFHGIFERFSNLKYKFGNKVFWAKGYFVSTVGLDTKKYKNIFVIKKKKI